MKGTAGHVTKTESRLLGLRSLCRVSRYPARASGIGRGLQMWRARTERVRIRYVERGIATGSGSCRFLDSSTVLEVRRGEDAPCDFLTSTSAATPPRHHVLIAFSEARTAPSLAEVLGA